MRFEVLPTWPINVLPSPTRTRVNVGFYVGIEGVEGIIF